MTFLLSQDDTQFDIFLRNPLSGCWPAAVLKNATVPPVREEQRLFPFRARARVPSLSRPQGSFSCTLSPRSAHFLSESLI